MSAPSRHGSHEGLPGLALGAQLLSRLPARNSYARGGLCDMWQADALWLRRCEPRARAAPASRGQAGARRVRAIETEVPVALPQKRKFQP